MGEKIHKFDLKIIQLTRLKWLQTLLAYNLFAHDPSASTFLFFFRIVTRDLMRQEDYFRTRGPL
jgi:hypothetical protein